MKNPKLLHALSNILPVLLVLALVGTARAQVTALPLIASDESSGDFFGWSVSLSEDRALVGAYGNDDLGNYSGSAYVFERQDDGSWNEAAKLIASDGAEDDAFGWSVSLSGDRALIGALFKGSVYVFERQDDGSWSETAKLTAADGTEGDRFGGSVSLSGDRALVGAFGNDELGDRSGSAYVFERQNDGSWSETAKLTAADGAEDDAFGNSVSLSGDRALTGAVGKGSAYVFERQNDGSWSETAKLTAADGAEDDAFGNSVSLSGDRALTGAVGKGSAYVFERQNDGSWSETAKLTAADGAEDDAFGNSVSLSGDRALTGAVGKGSAYVFERQNDGSWSETAKLTAADGAGLGSFGNSVSLVGERALIGAWFSGTSAPTGAAYLYDDLGTLSVAVERAEDVPEAYVLSEVYPNPFNPRGHFSVVVEQTQPVKIEVFNTLGRRMAILHEGPLAGSTQHGFTFEADAWPSGVYLLRVTGATFAATRTMTFLK